MSIDMLSLVFRHQFDDSERDGEDTTRRRGSSAGVKKLVMIAIADVANEDGERAFPGIRRIAKVAQTTLDTVRIALAHLIADGYLELVRASDGRYPDEYRIVIHRLRLQRAAQPRAPDESDDPSAARSARLEPRASARLASRAKRQYVSTSYASASPSEEPARWVPAPADARAPAPPPPEEVAQALAELEAYRARHPRKGSSG